MDSKSPMFSPHELTNLRVGQRRKLDFDEEELIPQIATLCDEQGKIKGIAERCSSQYLGGKIVVTYEVKTLF